MCHTCNLCDERGEFYVMGPSAGDWADYYCHEHLEDGKRALGPNAIVEDVRSKNVVATFDAMKPRLEAAVRTLSGYCKQHDIFDCWFAH